METLAYVKRKYIHKSCFSHVCFVFYATEIRDMRDAYDGVEAISFSWSGFF